MKIVKRILIVLVGFLFIMGSYVVYCYLAKKPVPFFGRKISGAYFSIGTNISNDPLQWNVKKTIVFDRKQNAIPEKLLMADPFLHFENGNWYAFFEIMGEKHADIGVAVEENGNWKYLGLALDEKLHLSYPFIFKHEGEIYMMPETKKFEQVRLYKATNFPLQWELDTVLLDDKKIVDATLFQQNDTWFMLATEAYDLRLYYSENLKGTWTEHPMSPIKSGNYTRSAGRVLQEPTQTIRFAQDHFGGYGRAVYGFSIDSISKTYYEESQLKNNPILKHQGETWTKNGMHHIDIHKLPDGTYKAIYDGYGYGKEKITFSFTNNL
ncbi:glucosamine inositolphosphorylceramide transferase family protein [Kordia jejudonensis]|uniref:glucosamine inositolphosphorylceramide transferase family protein n=1 Tax=Kordia jejudonensis TaxID=1348245 RepID=UPI00069A666E|nr:hypothetical protein [Kordia jejudonensis]